MGGIDLKINILRQEAVQLRGQVDVWRITGQSFTKDDVARFDLLASAKEAEADAMERRS